MTPVTEGSVLRAVGSGQRWYVTAVLAPDVLLCQNEVQQRHGLPGRAFKRLDESEDYDHAWLVGTNWVFAFSEREAALRVVSK